ncbi:MAG: iron-siderophore ABC transporter substrate-binding protein [Coleofasciculus sp. S288]|nr:iron-siderophore ABC transporter substrate-binding protein [Coleofasciculus sp. S288]
MVRQVLWAALAFILISACGTDPSHVGTVHSPDAAEQTAPADTVRRVKHLMGETQVPAYPKRVVVLNNAHLGNAIALGTIPTGAAIGLDQTYLKPYRAYLDDQNRTAPILVGNSVNPNLEKILFLKPDLTIGFDYHKSIYEQLSQISPTVLYDSSDINRAWKDLVRMSGEALGQAEEAEKLLSDYYQRTQELNKQIETQNLELSVSAVRVDQDLGLINLVLKDSFPGTIFQDVGLSRPSAQNKDGDLENISVELISHIDGDALFLITFKDEENLELVNQLKQNPLWSQLQAVKQNRVYQVDADRWFGYNIISANFVLDDLFKYLIEEE